MRRVVSVVFMLLLALAVGLPALAAGTTAGAKEVYYGTFKVSKIIMTVKGATLSSAKAKAFVGKTLTMSASSVSIGSSKLAKPTYQVSEMTAADFEGSWGIKASKLALPANITMVEVYTGKGMSADLWPSVGTIFVRNSKALVMHVEGVFFELK